MIFIRVKIKIKLNYRGFIILRLMIELKKISRGFK